VRASVTGWPDHCVGGKDSVQQADAEERQVRQTGDVTLQAGRAASQWGWYRYAAQHLAPGKSVLDAGCGLGVGLRELQQTASRAVGQELDPRLGREDVMITPLESIESKSFDVVVSIDVVEHVEDDAGFVRQLARIAREALFLTTPISARGKELWPYHVREYTPKALHELLQPLGRMEYFKGTPSGSEIYPVRNMAWFWAEDYAVNSPILNVPFRAAQKLLPRALRYNPHHGALIHLT
jgi:SAM-dependent methyltransferase